MGARSRAPSGVFGSAFLLRPMEMNQTRPQIRYVVGVGKSRYYWRHESLHCLALPRCVSCCFGLLSKLIPCYDLLRSLSTAPHYLVVLCYVWTDLGISRYMLKHVQMCHGGASKHKNKLVGDGSIPYVMPPIRRPPHLPSTPLATMYEHMFFL